MRGKSVEAPQGGWREFQGQGGGGGKKLGRGKKGVCLKKRNDVPKGIGGKLSKKGKTAG